MLESERLEPLHVADSATCYIELVGKGFIAERLRVM